MEDILKRIQEYALEEIMGDRFGKYAKEIIQDRAIPDVRDGLKPVQRRILYAMYRTNNTHEHGYIKCAATVGEVLGKYHPHGDSSVYDAMVRMSQWWKQNTILIDIHGNNGSMDGDSAAAYRYTESRLSKISSELLKDLDKGTVSWAPNFDDRFLEPTVLPAKFPNLLVNGANGISAGYATNIPPHNLGEVIDATIKRIESPSCHLETILDIVKGPDFPTGGIVEGKAGIIEALKTGKGRVIVKSKTEFKKEKGKEQIIIHEIPFEVNKALLVNKIESIRIDRKIEGMVEVRDETDRDGLRMVIDLKPNANKKVILNYLLKNTELQISYVYNMVAIVNRRPMTLGILELLDAYISHQREVILARTRFDLDNYNKRLHIVEGFLKMLSILDEVIKTIRKSKNKADAKENLIKEYNFTEEQAEAIVVLQLYKLTNTDVVALEEEHEQLLKYIQALESILNDENKLKEVMKYELKKIKTEYATPRKTEIKDEITEVKFDVKETIPKEDCIVAVSKDGYVKRISKRSYNKDEETQLKDNDYLIGLYEMNTKDVLILFTSAGNYLYIPVYDLPDLKWKELGKHISNIIKLNVDETIIKCMPVSQFDDSVITIFTKNGMVKRTLLKEYEVQRYSKPLLNIKLKDSDQVIDVIFKDKEEVLIVTQNGLGLRYKTAEIPITGIRAAGVKAITLKNDIVISANLFDQNDEYVSIVTNKSTAKRIRLSEVEPTKRTRKGIQIIRDVKTNPYKILKAIILNSKDTICINTEEGAHTLKSTDFPILDRYATGTSITKRTIKDIFQTQKLETIQNVEKVSIQKENQINDSSQSNILTNNNQNVDLNQVDKRIMTIDDFLDKLDIDE